MNDFLSSLYSGRIRPDEGTGKYSDKLMLLERQSDKILEELNSVISEEARVDLQRFIECQNEICYFIEQDAFRRGVEFTAKFFVSALD